MKKITQPQLTGTIEDYLSTLFVLERDGMELLQAELARMFQVAPPTVTATIQRMQRDGLVEQGSRGPRLTAAGREAARTVVRRHMLAEWMLIRFLKVPLDEAHLEAHRMEHAISGEVERQLQEQLEEPQACPHGNPLPGHEALAAAWTPLTEARPGRSFLIRRLHERAEEKPGVLPFLVESALVPGTKIMVKGASAVNDTLTVEVGKREVTLARHVACFVFGETGGN